MASMAMTASFLPVTAKHPSATAARRSLVVAKASTSGAAPNDGSSNANLEIKSVKMDSNQGRRELVAAAMTVAAATLAKAAMAEDEPERGSAEAKKKYAVICVTMPTARICRK